MYRRVEETKGKPKKVYGVLTDYDLSSWTDSLNPGYSKTSQQRTGTPPYMAQELLQGTSPLHLYRHDVESLFYVMLLVSARHSIGVPEGQKRPRLLMRDRTGLPYQKWFNQRDYDTLGSLKYSFLVGMHRIELSPGFEDFRPWLEDLLYGFSEGFKHKPNPTQLGKWRRAKPSTVEFEDETLGGYVTYATALAPVPYLKGKLDRLSIRDPEHQSAAPASPTSAGTP